MSDKAVEVECGTHGRSYATFVCQHLVNGRGLGFFAADDPDDPQPDAWCAACDKIRQD